MPELLLLQTVLLLGELDTLPRNLGLGALLVVLHPYPPELHLLRPLCGLPLVGVALRDDLARCIFQLVQLGLGLAEHAHLLVDLAL